jgi:type VI secretion system protein VasD
MNKLIVFSLFLFSVLVAGCAKQNQPLPERERIMNVFAEKDINPNKYNHAAPLSLFIYQLKALENFQAQDDEFFFLPDARGVTSFSQDVIAMKELTIKPGEKHEVRFSRQSDEVAFGIIAAFREIDKAVWKQEVVFPKDKVQPWYKKFFSVPESKVTIHIKKLSIEAKVME